MELAPGTLLAGRFEITGPPLGAGASGVVYPADDRATGRKVAAKVLHDELLGDEHALQQLQAEAAIAGRLRHPHVVDVVGLWSDLAGLPACGSDAAPGSEVLDPAAGAGAARPRWILVSERVDAVSLDRLGPIAPEAVVALGLQLTDALQAAADLGLVHGDVRPGNVLVGPTGARLFDFGIGRLSTERTPLRPGETAPERIDGGDASPATDVYGLGVVLYHALHGRLPFRGETAWAVIGAQHARVRAIEGPRGIATLIAAMLDPSPVDRPDLGMVRDALVRLRRRPNRRLWLRRPIPPFQPAAPWVVYGTDPRSGTQAVVRSGLSQAAARSLIRRLRAEGWQVRAIREKFGLRDVVWILAFAVAGSAIVPVLGSIVGLLVAVQWRAASIRPHLRRTLPALSVALPPKPERPARWPAVVGGLLLLLTAALLVWWPTGAILTTTLLIALVAWGWRPPTPEAAEVARQGRVLSALAELRAALDTRRLGFDELLSLTGEAERLEGDWSAGRLDAERVLVRVDDLLVQARSAPHAEGHRTTLEALRR